MKHTMYTIWLVLVLLVGCSPAGDELSMLSLEGNTAVEDEEPQLVAVTRYVTTFDGTQLPVTPSAPTATASPPFPLMAMATAEPRPDFIEGISPAEYRVIPLSVYTYFPENVAFMIVNSYDTGQPVSDNTVLSYGSSICLQPDMEQLAQEGDMLISAKWGEDPGTRMTLLVNGQPVEYDGYRGWTVLGLPPTREPSGPRTEYIAGADYCWIAPVGVGPHEVIFEFRQTSGDVKRYRWFFEISN